MLSGPIRHATWTVPPQVADEWNGSLPAAKKLKPLNLFLKPVSKTIQNRVVSDEELVLRLQRGDAWTFQLLVRRFRKPLFAIAFGITLDAEESRDIVQEVFLEVYRSIDRFRGDSSLGTWLRRITVNRCLNWKRRWARRFKWRHFSVDDSGGQAADLPSDAPSPESHLMRIEMQREIDRALKRLPDQARAVFILREVEGLSYEAIAEIAGIKLGTVRSRLYHARRQLQTILRPLVKEDT